MGGTTYIPSTALPAGTVNTTNDPWGTGTNGALQVITSKTQSGGPLKPVGPPPGDQGTSPTGYHYIPAEGGYHPLSFENQTSTVDNVLQAAQQFTQDQLKDLQSKLWLAGMYGGTGVKSAKDIPFGHYDENTIQAYANLLTLNGQQVQRGQNVAVDDTLAEIIQQRTLTGQTNQAGTTTRTSTSYSISDPEQAKSILDSVLGAYTGSTNPDANTLASFTSALQQYEQAHPSTSTSTYDASGGGTDTSTEGTTALKQAGKQQLAQDWLMQNKGAQVGAHQAATTYYQAALDALKSPVQIGQ